MARKYAILNNNIVVDVRELELEDLAEISKTSMVIDVEDQLPLPTLGYVLNGNKLELPQGQSSREQFEIDLSFKKTDFGIKLARSAVDRIGARNKILNKTGAQVSALLTQLLSVKLLLETGALGTARYACLQLRAVYTEYSDIFDMVCNEINSFEASFGL